MKIFSREKRNEYTVRRKTCERCGKDGYPLRINGKDVVLCPECLAEHTNIKSLGYTKKLADGKGRCHIGFTFSLPPEEFGGAEFAEVNYTYENKTATKKEWEQRAKLEIIAPLFGCGTYAEMMEILCDDNRLEEARKIVSIMDRMKRVRRGKTA